jgi:hypothetical protein
MLAMGGIKYQPQFFPHLHILTPFLFFSMGSGSCKKKRKEEKKSFRYSGE